MRVGLIGTGAIGQYVCDSARQRGHTIAALLVRTERLETDSSDSPALVRVDKVADLPPDIDFMIDCAGHSALQAYGADILRRGIDLISVSLGALADPDLFDALERAAEQGKAKLHLASGAIGSLDCLRAARVGELSEVTYVGRKPPQGWKGSPAETKLNLDDLSAGAETHFSGTARRAAIEYPKNANVAAAVALAGLGFDETRVELIADPNAVENIHQIHAAGDFGSYTFEIRGNSLPDNPRSSALAAMSVISSLEQESQSIVF